jgi:hypothetical protein
MWTGGAFSNRAHYGVPATRLYFSVLRGQIKTVARRRKNCLSRRGGIVAESLSTCVPEHGGNNADTTQENDHC